MTSPLAIREGCSRPTSNWRYFGIVVLVILVILHGFFLSNQPNNYLVIFWYCGIVILVILWHCVAFPSAIRGGCGQAIGDRQSGQSGRHRVGGEPLHQTGLQE